jgi:hypothetical protein
MVRGRTMLWFRCFHELFGRDTHTLGMTEKDAYPIPLSVISGKDTFPPQTLYFSDAILSSRAAAPGKPSTAIWILTATFFTASRKREPAYISIAQIRSK